MAVGRLENPKKLLVEGVTERWVLPQLLEAVGEVPWVEKNGLHPVHIQPFDGIENLTSGLIEAELNVRGRQVLGLVVDADEHPLARWQKLRDRCLRFHPGFPEAPPMDGLVLDDADVRLGAWMMPDNQVRGMLETFLAVLRTPESEPLWQHADSACTQALGLGAPFSGAHRDKALLHTWLSWQDPPGRQLHDAVKLRILSGRSPLAMRFVGWFKRLFEL